MKHRPLEFRIYDTKRKEWVHDTENAVSLFGETILFGEILRRPDDTHVSLAELDDLVVMQFTGLFDSKGRKIFEKDSLKGIGSVDFIAGRWESHHDGDECIDLGKMQNSLLEVIGNVYDNPELIN